MKTIEYPKIGKGMFSTVYRKDARTVLIKSVDPVKECISLGWFPKTPMFPTVKRISYEDDFSLYECRYYHKVSSLKKSLTRFEYEFYLALRRELTWSTGYNSLLKDLDLLPRKFARKREMLKDALTALNNYGSDIGFEISPRNVTAHNGKLVLLDCFFLHSALKKQRDKKRKYKRS